MSEIIGNNRLTRKTISAGLQMKSILGKGYYRKCVAVLRVFWRLWLAQLRLNLFKPAKPLLVLLFR